MSQELLPIAADERWLGRWRVKYVSPPGWHFAGHLIVTNQRIV